MKSVNLLKIVKCTVLNQQMSLKFRAVECSRKGSTARMDENETQNQIKMSFINKVP